MNKEWIPNSLTMSNGIFGFLSVISAAQQEFLYAGLCIIFAALADRYDGIIARKLGVVSPLGKELDSLCDVISFGLAPAFLILSKVKTEHSSIIFILTLIIASAFLACGAYRLARFNITTMANGFYTGVPITTCGGMLGLLSLFPLPTFLLVLLMAIFAYLMVSKLKIKKI